MPQCFGPGRGMMFGGIGMVLLILLIGFILYALYKLSQKNSKDTNSKNGALDILDKRYASGEISEEEYRKKKDDIIG